jgi:predicted Fe-S protein YdhL (DUF1289 family)
MDTGIPSPCVLICMMDARNLYCLGCHRTRDEIARWGGADDDERRAILDAVTEREAASG